MDHKGRYVWINYYKIRILIKKFDPVIIFATEIYACLYLSIKINLNSVIAFITK